MSGKILDSIFDSTTKGLEKTLDLSWRRSEAITSNIANAETPEYRAVDLSFSNELEQAFGQASAGGGVSTTNAKHLDTTSDSGAHLIQDFSGQTRSDGNNVDIDAQMGKLQYNASRYSLTSTLLQKKFYFLMQAVRNSS